MPDHWRALIRAGYPLTISQLIHDVKKVSARELHGGRMTQGPLWQHQFWDRFVRNADEFNQRLQYMHLNPVRKNLVSRVEEWKWSSVHDYTGSVAAPIGVDRVLAVDRVLLPAEGTIRI